MQTRAVISSMLLAAVCAPWMQSPATGETQMLPPPGFHHLHLNSVDPAAAIDFYTRQFASTSASSWGGLPALASPNKRPAAVQQGRDPTGHHTAVGDLA